MRLLLDSRDAQKLLEIDRQRQRAEHADVCEARLLGHLAWPRLGRSYLGVAFAHSRQPSEWKIGNSQKPRLFWLDPPPLAPVYASTM